MMKMFAKQGTKEKAIVPVPREAVGEVIKQLSETHGGNWLWVDKLQPGEGLLFSDNTEYNGFTGKDERYSDAIIKI